MDKEASSMNWSIENIPDNNIIFYRMHKQYYEDNPEIILGSGFKPQGKAMSTDWKKYSTPEQSLLRASSPNENRIISMKVGKIRASPLIIEHSPSKKYCNRAHTDVLGLKSISRSKKNRIREYLASNSIWVLLSEEKKRDIINKNIEEIKNDNFESIIDEIISDLKKGNNFEFEIELDDLYCAVAPLSGDRDLKELLLESIKGLGFFNVKVNPGIEIIVNKLKEIQENYRKAKKISLKHWNVLLNQATHQGETE